MAGQPTVLQLRNLLTHRLTFLLTVQVLDVFGGHEAPLSDVAFSPTEPIVASASWDGTVKLWNIYKSELVEVSLSAAGLRRWQ